MDINKQSFKEVVLNLAHRYQIPVKSLAPEQQKEIQKTDFFEGTIIRNFGSGF